MKKTTLLMCCILFAALLTSPLLSRSQGISSPSGFGVSGETLYGGFVGNFTQPYTTSSDLAVTLGAGFGDPVKGVGVQVESSLLNLAMQSLGTAGIAFHKVLHPGVSMAVGFENLLSFGPDASSNPNSLPTRSVYFAVSHAVGVKYPGTFIGRFSYSIGAGYGRFSRLTFDDLANNNRQVGTYVFGAIKCALTDHLNVNTEWNGTNLNAALTANTNLGKVPFSVFIGYMDLTNYSGNGARFIGGLSFAYNFKGLKSKQPVDKKIQQILQNQEQQELDAIIKSAK